jgi:hypothetical protein|tara:strand:- start:70 stop:174 length:105 start_codon:yes stop_codon:yes gene_type:complete
MTRAAKAKAEAEEAEAAAATTTKGGKAQNKPFQR